MEIHQNIRAGTAGWSYKDWHGIVYPPNMTKSFDELGFISSLFDTVEINSSFYRPPAPHASESWIRRTEKNPRFMFTCKLWQRFTHQRDPFGENEINLFKSGINPIKQSGKLGAVLIQFPWSFKNTPSNISWMLKLLEIFSNYSPVVELRHGSWDTKTVFDLLNKNNAGFACIDQPVIGNSIKPRLVVTGKTGYIRLHGRNYDAWFPEKSQSRQNPNARYDYLYTDKEIRQWAENTIHISKKAESVYVIQNNHPWGQAVANSLQLMAALNQPLPGIPESLILKFPYLKR